MTRRQVRRRALHAAYLLVEAGRLSPREYDPDDGTDAAIRRELDRIAQRLYEQYARLAAGQEHPR